MVKHGTRKKSRKLDLNNKTKCVELYNNNLFSVYKYIKTVVPLPIKHVNIKASLVFSWFLQNKTRVTRVWRNWQATPHTSRSLKIVIFDLQIVANIWDIVSTQVNKIYNTGLVVFGYFTAKFLHIAPLTHSWCHNYVLHVFYDRQFLNYYISTTKFKSRDFFFINPIKLKMAWQNNGAGHWIIIIFYYYWLLSENK